MDTGKILLGVLAGVAAGAMAGILFAPAKGSRTRRRILRKGEGYVEELKEKFNEYADTITEKLEMAREEVSAFAQKGNEKFEEAEKKVKAAKL